MRHLWLALLGMVLFIGCNNTDGPVLYNDDPPVPSHSLSLQFGQEINTNGVSQFIPLDRSDEFSYYLIRAYRNIGVRITENGVPFPYGAFTPASLIVRVVTSSDSEVFVGNANSHLLSYGGSALASDPQTFFEMIMPTILDSAATPDNGVIELNKTANDFVEVTYSSPWSTLQTTDRLYVLHP